MLVVATVKVGAVVPASSCRMQEGALTKAWPKVTIRVVVEDGIVTTPARSVAVPTKVGAPPAPPAVMVGGVNWPTELRW